MVKNLLWGVLAPICAIAFSVAAVAPTHATEYTRLIPSNPPPPPVAPEASRRGVIGGTLLDLLGEAGPYYNETRVREELQKNLRAAMESGIKEATRLGQKGMLVKVQLLKQPATGGKDYYSLRGSGAVLIGVGPDANAVCFAQTCYNTLESPIPNGVTLAPDSGYLWAERVPGSEALNILKFDIYTLESRARQVYFNGQASEAYRRAVVADAVKGYAEQLARSVTAAEDKAKVDALIASRNDAATRLRDVEAELERELRRADRAAKTSATLNAIAGAFNFASSMYAASLTLGEDVSKASGGAIINSKDDLMKVLQSIEASSRNRVKALSVQQGTIRNSITGSEASLFQIGVQYDMTAPEATVLRPKP